jgi:hypothetical protein
MDRPAQTVSVERLLEDLDGVCGCGCGKPLNLGALWPEPDSPSVAHDPPLSCGGEHTQKGVSIWRLDCNLADGRTVATPRAAKIKRARNKLGGGERPRPKHRLGRKRFDGTPINPWGYR